MNRHERIVTECIEAFGLDQTKIDRLTKLLEKMEEVGKVYRPELEEIVGTDAERFARFLDILDFDNPDEVKSPEEEAAEPEITRRIMDYLSLNNFESLADAEKRGRGDTSPLGSHVFKMVRRLAEDSRREKH
jgi:hypothetical protein